MRMKFWDRLLAALAGLLIALVGIGLFVYGIGVFPFKLDLSVLQGPFTLWQRAAIVAVAVVLFALGLHSISILFRRKRDKGFILQQTEYGDMSISMKALENMVRRCVDAYDELTVNSIGIFRQRDGIVVELRITLRSGVNIPITVNALQKQIKQYITSCSGVDVQRVRVLVETDTAKLMAPQPVPITPAAPMVEEPAPVEEPTPEKQRFADRFFHHKEEPAAYTASEPEAPVVEEAQPAPVEEEKPEKQRFADRFFHHKEEPAAYTASEPEAPVVEEAQPVAEAPLETASEPVAEVEANAETVETLPDEGAKEEATL